PIQVGRLIARSIKRMVTAFEVYIGHPFVITFLCQRLGVPTRGQDDVRRPMDSIGRNFFQKAQRDANMAYAEQAAAAEAPSLHPPPQQQHQVPPHIPSSSSIQILRWGWLPV
ncbi:hypothetical protein A2U01_0044134, partial [Trifolium medium]|nr:hypothetical protein [Trifolium medium]